MRTRFLVFPFSLALVGCGEVAKPTPAPVAPTPPTAAAPTPPLGTATAGTATAGTATAGTATAGTATADHGASVDLGRVTIAGHELAVVRLGDVVPGKEGAFEVALVKGPAGATVNTVALYAWVEAQEGEPASAPAKGTLENGKLHVHVTPKADAKPLKRIVLRLRYGNIDERGSLPLDGHGHEHGPTPHEGVVAVFQGPDGAVAGHLELKLHDDKGDLELWVAKDDKLAQPFDLPLDAVVKVQFVDVGNRTVELRVRNAAKNEDEDGAANVRDGRTNYFIFPGETGADAKWLMGTTFTSIVRLTFTVDGKAYASEEFMLVPHTHADGTDHK